MTPVSVWERVYVNETMVHADAHRIAIIAVGNPVLSITK